MKIPLFIVFVLLIGAFFIISEKQILLNSKENIKEFFLNYQEWFAKTIDNIRVISAEVIKTEWLPE